MRPRGAYARSAPRRGVFIGHGLVAFAGAAGAVSLAGYRRERALALGVCAGAFALAPDVDILYAPVGLAEAARSGTSLIEGFWESGNRIHRAVTHSLLVGAATSVAVGCFAAFERRDREGTAADRTRAVLAAVAALSVLGGLVVVTGVESGPLGAVVTGVFAIAGLAITTAAARWGLSAREIAAAALIGLLSHPFGDLFTGEPPAFLYPLDATLVAERIALHPDPTLHLLGAFGIELATFWLAALVSLAVLDRPLRTCIDWRAALGIGYAGAALALPAPTLESSYTFVLSVLALGIVLGASPGPGLRSGGSIGFRRSRSSELQDRSPEPRDRSPKSRGRSVAGVPARAAAVCRRPVLDDPVSAALTGLTAVMLALGAYTLTYVYLIGP